MHIRIVFITILFLLAVFMLCYGDTVKSMLVFPAAENAAWVGETNGSPRADDNERKAGGVINYTAVGDSITFGVGASTSANNYVERLAQFIGSDTGMTVNVDNRGVNGMTSAQLLTALQTDAAMRTSLQNAQLITVNIGSNDFAAARASYRNLTCGVIDSEDCLRTAIAQFRSNWNLIVQEILALRANSGVSVRAFDLYYPTVQIDISSDSFPGDGINDFQALRPYLDEANMHIRTVSLSNGIALGRVHRSFNGIDGNSDPGTMFDLIFTDGFHPNDRGHSVIADRLRTTSPICLPPPLNGPRAFYRAEGDANDTTANNNHGTLENGTSFTAGEIGQAFSFDGVDDSVLLPQLALGLNYTIEMWIDPAPTQSVSFVHLASNDQSASNAFGALGLFTNTPGTPGNYSLRYAESSATVSTPPVIQPGRWTHVALTHSAGIARLYVDGILLASGNSTGDYDNQLRLGHSVGASTAFYTGAIDEVSLFDRTLSSSEIVSIVDADDAGRCGPTSNLQIAPATITVNAGIPQAFTATGGTSPYTFTVSNNPPIHGTVNPFDGVYVGSTAGVDTVQVRDASLFTSTATVTVVAGIDVPCPSGQKVWDGGGSTNNWSDAANWCGNTLPGTNSNIVFDSTSIKDATVDVNVSVNKINIAASYTGTITVADTNMNFAGGGGQNSSQAGGTFTNGSGTLSFFNTFTLDGGVFNSGSGDVSVGAQLAINGGIFNNPALPNAGNVSTTTSFSDLVINGGTFNAPGTLTLASGLTYNGGTFDHRNRTVVFAGSTNEFLTIGPSEIVFNNLVINRATGTNQVIVSGTNRTARVIGTLTLTEGAIGISGSNAVMRAEGQVVVGAGFGDQSANPPAGSGTLVLQNGPAGRMISVPAGASLPRVIVDDPNVTVNLTGAGTVVLSRLTMLRGAVNGGATNLTVGVGSGFGGIGYDQTGGSFSIGSGNFLCQSGFQMSQPDNANPSSFTGGSGNFTYDSLGRAFDFSGGTFNAPTGATLINTGVLNNVMNVTGGTFNSNGSFECQCVQFTLAGGTFNATSGTSTFGRVFNRTNGTFNPNGGTVVFVSTPGGSMAGNATTFHNLTVAFTGNNHQVFATVTGTLRLQSGILDNNGSSLTVEGDVIVESGFGGANSPITFSGTGTQNYTNSGGPNPTGIWTINKPSGTLNLNSDLDISNGTANFVMTNGNIVTGNNLVSTGARFVSGGVSSFIIGNLRRAFPGGGQDITRRFDVGTNSGYAPVNVRVPITPGPTSGTLTPLKVSTVGSPHPLFDPAHSLSFYWVISEGVGLVGTDVTFTYPQTAVNGDEAGYKLDRIENGQIQILNDIIFITTNTVTLTGRNDFAAEWTMSELPPPLVLSCPSTSANPGGTVQCTASGGRTPYQFSLAVNNSGASINSGATSVTYTAGTTTGVTDTLRLTDFLSSTVDVMITVVDAFTVINTNDSGPGSLRQAIINSNNAPGTQTITFAIPGPPPYSISAVSPRRFNISDTVVIDGTTQPGFPGSPIVEVKNAQFNLFANNSTIKGLVINGATQGIDTRGIFIGGNSSGNTIQGNYVGTDLTGNAAAGNGTGIEIGGDGNIIGGAAPAERNVIAGNLTHGIYLFNSVDAVANNVIRGNLIGVGADGMTAVGNSDSGIHFDGAQNNIIGGVGTNEGNVIANNLLAGISTSNLSSQQSFGNAIRGNSIFANGGLGIDLRPNGVSANDSCDADAGENRRQNFPDLTFVSSFGGTTNVQGTLNAEAGKTFTLDFYSNAIADDSGFGEGQSYLGSGQVTTPASCTGPIAFNINLSVALPSGHVVTATATDPAGNTSEFSAFLGVQPADISGTLLTSGGSPVKGAQARLRRAGSTRILQTAATDRFGKFKFANVPLGFNYEVEPVLPNFVFVPATRTYPTLVTSQNDSYTAVVNNFSISGRITMDGFTVSNATVTLSGAANATTTSDSTGDYIFNNLPSGGTYTVTPTKPDIVFTPPSVTVPTITGNQTVNFTGTSLLSALPGRIYFAQEGDIKAINPDGTGRVTVVPKNGQSTFSFVRSSRSGDRLALTASFATGNTTIGERVRTSSIDGTFISGLLFGGNPCSTPTFSPNANLLACSTYVAVGNLQTVPILRFNADGTGTPEPLTATNTNSNREPDWSPDGSSIVYSKHLNQTTSAIWKVDVTTLTETEVRFEPNANVSEPRWSPDGTKIVFDRISSSPFEDSIAVMNADGSNFHIIATSNPSNFITDPAWAPDGSRIAFVKNAGGGAFQLVTTLPDGSDFRVIDPAFNRNAFDWGPDNNVATPAGTNTHVDSGRVHITFPSTSNPGATTITPIDPAAAGNTPGGFVVDGVAFEISTTATFTPPVEVCVTLTLIEPTQAQFNNYFFMHNEGGVMVDRTSFRDFTTRRICGSLPSFSPVALMKQVDPALPTISGLVLDANGNPMNDVPVSISDDEVPVKTDFNGYFEFVNLKPGADYNIQAFKEGHLFAPPYQTFFNLSGDQTVVFNAMPADFEISGTVVDGLGAPIQGVTVQLKGDVEVEIVTGADGAFTFTGLPANGSFTVRPLMTGNPFMPGEVSVGPIESDLTGLVFQQFAPTAGGVSVGGRLTNADGFGISGASLVLTARDGSKQVAITGPFGYYRFDDVQVGETYFLEVSHKRYQFNGSPRVLRVLDEVTDIDFIGLLEDELDRFR